MHFDRQERMRAANSALLFDTGSSNLIMRQCGTICIFLHSHAKFANSTFSRSPKGGLDRLLKFNLIACLPSNISAVKTVNGLYKLKVLCNLLC